MAAGPLCGGAALAAYELPIKLLYHSPQQDEEGGGIRWRKQQ